MNTLVVQETEPDETATKDKTTLCYPNSENSADIPRQWSPVRPRTVSKPTPLRALPLFMFENHEGTTFLC